MGKIFKDQSFYFEWIRTIGYAAYGGADINECLKTAERIREKDFESWYREWVRLAEQVYEYAQESADGGHRVSAREAYLRAGNYYRTSEFYLHGNREDKRASAAWAKSRDCFLKALPYLDFPGEIVRIPYEDTNLPGYFFRQALDGVCRPTLIAMTGFDGTAEEMYLNIGAAALSRGYNVLLFEGPGQGAALREQKLYFRPDWEKVVTPAVDYLLTRPETDPDRIILAGYSFGGYLIPRAAAFEHRLAACIANSGVFDYFSGSVLKSKPISPFMAKELAKESSPMMDWMTGLMMRTDTTMRWAIQDGLWKFNIDTPHKLMKAFQAYTMEGIANKIHCPTLVCDSESEGIFPGQAKLLYERLECPKTWMHFTAGEYTENHCQGGAVVRSNQRILDWLDERFQKG